MKKGNYYIYTRQYGEEKAVNVTGYLIPDPQSGLTFGARFRAGSGWEITELSTGALIIDDKHQPKTAKDISQFINDRREVVLSAVQRPHLQKVAARFTELVEEAKADETK